MAGLEPVGRRFEPCISDHHCGYSSVVELFVANEVVVSSNLIARSIYALVVQLAEAPVLETGCCKFESYRGHHFKDPSSILA